MNQIAQVDIGSVFNTPWGQGSGLADLASVILSNSVIAAAIILLFLFVFGGISMIIGAGQGNPESTARGKKAVTSALVGFLIIFTAYWIIRIVETIAGFSILNPPG
jgi:hypothetical protein